MASGAQEFPIANLGRQAASRGGSQLRAKLLQAQQSAQRQSQFSRIQRGSQAGALNRLTQQNGAAGQLRQNEAVGQQNVRNSYSPGGVNAAPKQRAQGPAGQLRQKLMQAQQNRQPKFRGGPVRYNGYTQ